MFWTRQNLCTLVAQIHQENFHLTFWSSLLMILILCTYNYEVYVVCCKFHLITKTSFRFFSIFTMKLYRNQCWLFTTSALSVPILCKVTGICIREYLRLICENILLALLFSERIVGYVRSVSKRICTVNIWLFNAFDRRRLQSYMYKFFYNIENIDCLVNLLLMISLRITCANFYIKKSDIMSSYK